MTTQEPIIPPLPLPTNHSYLKSWDFFSSGPKSLFQDACVLSPRGVPGAAVCRKGGCMGSVQMKLWSMSGLSTYKHVGPLAVKDGPRSGKKKVQVVLGYKGCCQRPGRRSPFFWCRVLRSPWPENLNLALEDFMKVCPSRKEAGFSGMLEPAYKVSGEVTAIFFSKPHVQWCHVGSLKLATVGIFTP